MWRVHLKGAVRTSRIMTAAPKYSAACCGRGGCVHGTITSMKTFSHMFARFVAPVICGVMPFMSVTASSEAEYGDEYEFSRLYAGASATMVLPQGGSDMRRLGGASARIGYYLFESLAVEVDAAWLEDCAGLGVQGLWHCWGYERFDPFATFGARGWIDGDVGPAVGFGAFYHITDEWSFRGDVQATLGMDDGCDMVYSMGLGVQYTF